HSLKKYPLQWNRSAHYKPCKKEPGFHNRYVSEHWQWNNFLAEPMKTNKSAEKQMYLRNEEKMFLAKG
ncbi:MAG TPA: hypothetical protein VIH86_05610, partial [Puia sp.]